MRIMILPALAATLAGCHTAPAITLRCPPDKVTRAAGYILCQDGDPGILAALPDWAKLPAGVTLEATTTPAETDPDWVGYVGKFRAGGLDLLEPVVRKQLAAAPELSPRRLSPTLFNAVVPGDGPGSSITLTQMRSGDRPIVEVRVIYYRR